MSETQGPKNEKQVLNSHSESERLYAEHQQLQNEARWRKLVPTHVDTQGYLIREGKRLLNVASNDYLGLRREWDQNDWMALQQMLAEQGEGAMSGSGASRLVTGHDPFLDQLEQRFAAYKQKPRALFFPSGYAANVGLLQALVGRDDLVFADRYIHASLYDGILLSRAKLQRYSHLDVQELEQLLRAADQKKKNHTVKWIITDSVFSMDGTVAPLPELVELAERFGARLIVDEAHGGGVFGERGEGLVHAFGLQDRVDVLMGTFSKAYGAYGAYVAANEIWIDQLIQAARSFIYSTGMPNVMWANVAAQWARVQNANDRRLRVLELSKRFADQLRAAGLPLGLWGNDARFGVTPIVPVIVGENSHALKMADQLQANGIAAIAIRPPTVPEGQARIRFSWSAVHGEQQVDDAAQEVIRLWELLEA